MTLIKRNFINKRYFKDLNKIFILILLIVPISQLTLEQYLPSLPAMEISWSSTSTMMQLTVSLYLLGLGISQLIYGALSDYYGRKKILIFGLIIYTLASIVTAITSSVHLLLIGRILQGLGIGVGSVLPKAMARDIYKGSVLTKALSTITIVWTLTIILAPLIGGYVQQYSGWRTNFYIFSIYSSLLLFVVWKYLPETNFNLKKEFKLYSVLESYKLILKDKIFLGYTLSLTLSFGILIAISISAPFLLQNQLRITPESYGQFMMLIGISYIFGNILSNFLSKKYNNKFMIYVGELFILLGSLIFILVSNKLTLSIPAFMAPIGIIVFGIGLMYANCMAITLNIYPKVAGTASAVLGSFLMLGSCIVSIIISHISAINSMPLAKIIFLIAFIIAFIQIILTKKYPLPID